MGRLYVNFSISRAFEALVVSRIVWRGERKGFVSRIQSRHSRCVACPLSAGMFSTLYTCSGLTARETTNFWRIHLRGNLAKSCSTFHLSFFTTWSVDRTTLSSHYELHNTSLPTLEHSLDLALFFSSLISIWFNTIHDRFNLWRTRGYFSRYLVLPDRYSQSTFTSATRVLGRWRVLRSL